MPDRRALALSGIAGARRKSMPLQSVTPCSADRGRGPAPSRQHFHPKVPRDGQLRARAYETSPLPGNILLTLLEGGLGQLVIALHPILIITQEEQGFGRVRLQFLRIF